MRDNGSTESEDSNAEAEAASKSAGVARPASPEPAAAPAATDPVFDLAAVDEGDVRFVDNPWLKAQRAAYQRNRARSSRLESEDGEAAGDYAAAQVESPREDNKGKNKQQAKSKKRKHASEVHSVLGASLSCIHAELRSSDGSGAEACMAEEDDELQQERAEPASKTRVTLLPPTPSKRPLATQSVSRLADFAFSSGSTHPRKDRQPAILAPQQQAETMPEHVKKRPKVFKADSPLSPPPDVAPVAQAPQTRMSSSDKLARFRMGGSISKDSTEGVVAVPVAKAVPAEEPIDEPEDTIDDDDDGGATIIAPIPVHAAEPHRPSFAERLATFAESARRESVKDEREEAAETWSTIAPPAISPGMQAGGVRGARKRTNRPSTFGESSSQAFSSPLFGGNAPPPPPSSSSGRLAFRPAESLSAFHSRLAAATSSPKLASVITSTSPRSSPSRAVPFSQPGRMRGTRQPYGGHGGSTSTGSSQHEYSGAPLVRQRSSHLTSPPRSARQPQSQQPPRQQQATRESGGRMALGEIGGQAEIARLHL